jgi:hypothetical protein
MAPAALLQWQHSLLSAVNFVAFLSNFLVAFAPLPQAIAVHQVRSPSHSSSACLVTSPQRKSTGSLRLSVYHLTCVNFLYATLYALEIKNNSIALSSFVNWILTAAFTAHLIAHLDQSQRVCGWLLLLLCFALPVASVLACHSTARDCADLIGRGLYCVCSRAPLRIVMHLRSLPLPRRHFEQCVQCRVICSAASCSANGS